MKRKTVVERLRGSMEETPTVSENLDWTPENTVGLVDEGTPTPQPESKTEDLSGIPTSGIQKDLQDSLNELNNAIHRKLSSGDDDENAALVGREISHLVLSMRLHLTELGVRFVNET